jgi:hypothetical protein
MNLHLLFGKIVQVQLGEGWHRNAIGILADSILGPECVAIMPVPETNELLKSTLITSVAKPLHINRKDISGIFELEFSHETKNEPQSKSSG